jgi:DNA-binding HxlR family transcriptional regulator
MTPKPANPYDMNCPSRGVLELVGSKWAMLLLCSLQKGPVRTGDLMRAVGGISQKMFTQTIRELERNGLVERISYPEVPPRVEYKLTKMGQSISKLIKRMEKWVVANFDQLLASQIQNKTRP